MTLNLPASGGQTVRIGGHVYQVNVTQAQVEARNIDRERARQLSRETSRRRRALQDRKQQIEVREENKRQAELAKRREKQREATERYQRAHIPQRRRFSSPVLDKTYSAPALTFETNIHSLGDTRFQRVSPKKSVVNREEVDEHALRTLHHRAAFEKQFHTKSFHVGPGVGSTAFSAQHPHPPKYPKPPEKPQKPDVKNAWDNEPPSQPQIQPKDESFEDSECEDDANDSTFIVEHISEAVQIKRCSTPEPVEILVPKPPDVPKPTSMDPRTMKILNRTSSVQAPKNTPEQVPDHSKVEPIQEIEEKIEILEPKGILKKRVARRIVSANSTRGIIAASIRDSLELVQGKTPDGQRAKTVRWDKLYYDDETTAEFATDGKPRFIPEKPKKGKSNRRVSIKKAQIKTEKTPTKGKKGKKTKKQEPVQDVVSDSPMVYRHSSYSVVPTPSASSTFKTESPQYKHDLMSSRVPIPPTVARPLTARTQILRSKRIVTTTNPIRVPPKPTIKVAEPNYIVNSNNQLNIHIGSVEVSHDLNRTPTDNDITWLWDRVRTVLENSQKPSKRNRPSSVIHPKSSNTPTFTKTRPHSAHVNSSTAAFTLAEELAQRGVSDDRILNTINASPARNDPRNGPHNPPQTALSLEEAQIEQSLQRLDDRLLHIQEVNGYNAIAFHNRH